MNNYEQTMLIVPTPGGATVVASRPGGDGWLPVVAHALKDVLPNLLNGDEEYSSRFFAMSESDLALWDSMRKSTKAGYSLAQARTEQGKIHANLRVREVGAPSATAPTLDPLALSNAAALASIQASIEELTVLVTRVLSKVTQVVDFLETAQQAELLAAEEIIDQVHARFLATGAVTDRDAARLYGLEHCLRTVHREVVAELGRVAQRSAYRSPEAAAKFREDSADRVDVLIQLEVHLLRALARWLQLDLAMRYGDGDAIPTDSDRAIADFQAQADAACEALRELAAVDTHMEGRNWWDALWYKGWIGTEIDEDNLRKAVEALRGDIQALATRGLASIGRLAAPATDGLTSGRALEVGPPVLRLVS